ncbi:MAG: hypothetical protein HeimC3_16250 [Candidatus Heimdallarchaeota archaeon LC_3]|nr:MAG: hypothetical protein HeimC3_16250 [Candidatus Heimdallarchaeota archaeon LC_3]
MEIDEETKERLEKISLDMLTLLTKTMTAKLVPILQDQKNLTKINEFINTLPDEKRQELGLNTVEEGEEEIIGTYSDANKDLIKGLLSMNQELKDMLAGKTTATDSDPDSSPKQFSLENMIEESLKLFNDMFLVIDQIGLFNIIIDMGYYAKGRTTEKLKTTPEKKMSTFFAVMKPILAIGVYKNLKQEKKENIDDSLLYYHFKLFPNQLLRLLHDFHYDNQEAALGNIRTIIEGWTKGKKMDREHASSILEVKIQHSNHLNFKTPRRNPSLVGSLDEFTSPIREDIEKLYDVTNSYVHVGSDTYQKEKNIRLLGEMIELLINTFLQITEFTDFMEGYVNDVEKSRIITQSLTENAHILLGELLGEDVLTGFSQKMNDEKKKDSK